MVSKNKPVNQFLGFDSKAFGSRLTEERKLLGFSQVDIRIRTGVGKSAQINYEAGTTVPDAKYLWALFGAGFDVMYLLTGERSPDAPMRPDLQNLLEVYEAAQPVIREAAFAVLLSPYRTGSVEKAANVPGYFRHEILGEEDSRFEAHHAKRRAEQTETPAKIVRELTPDQAAMLDNYVNCTPEGQATLRETGAALEKSVDGDGEAHCA